MKVVLAEIGDKGALASSSIAALDAALFPQKSPFLMIMPSFNHFEQNAHMCPPIYYPSAWIFNQTREPSQWKVKRAKKQEYPYPSSRTWCSGRHRCYPRRAAQPLILLLLPLPRYTGDGGWEPKWWCFNGGDSYRTRPPTPTPGSDGSLAPKMPDSVPPSRKRRHPSRVPRLPFAAGGGRGRGRGSATERNIAGRGSPRENARGPPHSSLHCFVFRHFPVTLNHRRPPRRLSPPGALALGKNGSAEGEVILSIPPATRCC